MSNPFERRASEYMRDDHAFLSMVSPEPLERFISYANTGQLFDRLVKVIGTPGSGKTTLASLLEYPRLSLATRLERPAGHNIKDIIGVLVKCRMVEDNHAVVVATRLPMESEYRDYHELPYPSELRHRLCWTMIQARAMHGWIRGITRAEQIHADAITFHFRSGTESLSDAIGGHKGRDILARAMAVEKAIYQIGAALFPSPEAEFPNDARTVYRPLDIIEAISFIDKDSVERRLHPLLILDDVHLLHPDQRKRMEEELGRRELRFARWLLTRMDTLSFHEALGISKNDESDEKPGLQLLRETPTIKMQDDKDQQFEQMIPRMADRYLRQMNVFFKRGRDFRSLLSTPYVSLTTSKISKLREAIDSIQNKLKISPSRRLELLNLVIEYSNGCKDPDIKDEDVQLAVLSILMHRYNNRIPKQKSLFEENDDPDPIHPLGVDSSVVHAARLHLFHNYDRVYYYGINCLIKAASQNPEIFLKLAVPLVSSAETRLIKGRDGALDASTQQKLLQQRASEIHDKEWSFPRRDAVRRLTNAMAKECLQTSLMPNARNGAGNNAFGILQSEFKDLDKKHRDLAEILHYAVAYNAILFKPDYNQGGKKWCLLQLGGTLILEHGLTWMQGGFLERSVGDLVRMLSEPDET